MKRLLFVFSIGIACFGQASFLPPPLPNCSATVTTNCTPQLNSSGALLPGPWSPANGGVGSPSRFLSAFGGARIALEGDSFVALNSNPATCPGSSGSPCGPYDRGYLDWALALLQQRAIVVVNDGVGGTTSAQQAARFAANVLPYTPDICIIPMTVNDPGQGITASQTMTNMVTMFNLARNAGCRIVTATICPTSTFDAAKSAVAMEANQRMREYVRSNADVVLVDLASIYVDAAAATYAPLSGATVDGIHPTATSAWKMGVAVYNALNPLIRPRPSFTVWNGDTGVLTLNPLLIGSSGTVVSGTGVVATSFQLYGSANCVASLAARTDGIAGGQIQTFTLPSGAAATDVCQLYQAVTLASGKVSVGDAVYLQVEVPSWATVNGGVNAELRCTDSGSVILQQMGAMSYHSADAALVSTQTTRSVFRSLPYVVPANCTTVRGYTSLYGEGTLSIGRFEIRKVLP